jgi:hypothetical protein
MLCGNSARARSAGALAAATPAKAEAGFGPYPQSSATAGRTASAPPGSAHVLPRSTSHAALSSGTVCAGPAIAVVGAGSGPPRWMLAGPPTMPLLPTLTLVGAGWASGGSSGPAGPSCVLDVVFAALWAGLVYMLRASCSYAWSCFVYVVLFRVVVVSRQGTPLISGAMGHWLVSSAEDTGHIRWWPGEPLPTWLANATRCKASVPLAWLVTITQEVPSCKLPPQAMLFDTHCLTAGDWFHALHAGCVQAPDQGPSVVGSVCTALPDPWRHALLSHISTASVQ